MTHLTYVHSIKMTKTTTDKVEVLANKNQKPFLRNLSENVFQAFQTDYGHGWAQDSTGTVCCQWCYKPASAA